MPSRLQQKYSFNRAIPGVETFHVKLMYDNTMPVVYIHYSVDGRKNEARRLSQSTAIVYVRKYLEDKLNDHPTVEFQMLGPSPFHADILLDEPEVDSNGNTDRSGQEDLTEPGDGYRTLFFTYLEQKKRKFFSSSIIIKQS